MAHHYTLEASLVLSFSADPTDTDYVLDICAHESADMLAASSSNHCVKLYHRPSLSFVRDLPAHTERINEIAFASTQGLFLSASSDGYVFAWDPRVEGSVQRYHVQSEAFTVSAGGTAEQSLAVGTETEVSIWDIRSQQMVMQYEPHTEDVTQVKFHPSSPSLLFTGGMDGLVYVLDTSTGASEDDATVAMFNVEEPVSQIGLFGPAFEFMHVRTSVETFSLWNVSTLDRLASYDEARAMVSTACETHIDFLAGLHFDQDTSQLMVIGGSYESGDVSICSVEEDGTLAAQCCLSNGHVDAVRAFYWDPQSEYIITGGEDSRLCCWRREDLVSQTPQLESGASTLKAMRDSNERFAPY